MPAAPAGLSFGAIAPQDAFEQYSARRLLRPSFRWQDVWQAEHTRAFTVAGVMRLDVLAIFRDELEAALARGADLADFAKAVKPKLVAKGFWGNVEVTDPATGEVRTTKFNDARLRLIFDVNMRQSHAAGRWARGMRGRKPFVVYLTMADERVRKSHQPWHGLVLPRDHPFWDTHLPPNGWMCRCYFMFVDEAGVAALQKAGVKIRREAPKIETMGWKNTATGQVEQVPAGIDPGFAYNPGKVHVQRAAELQVQALNRLTTLRSTGPTQARAGGDEGTRLARAAVHRTRREAGFAQFLKNPPLPVAGEPAIGMPVAVLPPVGGAAPTVASVSATALAEQATAGTYPYSLPTTVAGWAMAQSVIDRGAKLLLGGTPEQVLWYWVRGNNVETLLLQRDALVWWVVELARLSKEEAAAKYPRLGAVLP